MQPFVTLICPVRSAVAVMRMPFKTSFFAAVTAKPRLCKSVIKLAAEGSHTMISGVLPRMSSKNPLKCSSSVRRVFSSRASK